MRNYNLKIKNIFRVIRIYSDSSDRYLYNNENSFTLIEVLLALLVLAVGILSVIALSSKSYIAISLQKNKLIANNLVREGMELVRNVRNENWLYTGQSHCNNDNTSTACSEGRISEEDNDCDWRCGSKNINPNDSQFFRLDENLKDLDYTGHIIKGLGPFSDCKNLDHIALKKDNNGWYQHQNGTDTKFRRLIIIDRDKDLNDDNNPNNDIQVTVKVCWQERGNVWQEVSAEAHLYNWYVAP